MTGARNVGLGAVAVFPLVGILIGPQALGLIDIKVNSTFNQVIILFGASYILFDGGASLRLNILRRVWITIVTLATVGVLVTATLTGIVAHYVLGLPPALALLLGTTIASTDPATLVPIFQQVHIRARVAQTVISKSAFNDATGAIATFAVLEFVNGGVAFSLSWSLLGLFDQLIVGIIAGAFFGYVAALLIAHERWAFLADYAPVVTVAAMIGAYFGAADLKASGFTAVFVFGIVLGNQDALGFKMAPDEARKLADFAATTAFIMRLFIFILLGSQVDFELMGRYLAGGIVMLAVFIVLVRPFVVFLCALPDRRAKWTLSEMLFMCWIRETGVIPAALAGLLRRMQRSKILPIQSPRWQRRVAFAGS